MSVLENAIFAYFQIPQIVKRPAPPRPAPPKLDGTNTAPVPSPRKVDIKTCRKLGRLCYSEYCIRFRFKYFIPHKHVYLYSTTKVLLLIWHILYMYVFWRSDKG